MSVSTAVSKPRHAATDRWSLAPGLPRARDTQRMLVAVASGSGERVDSNFENAEAFLLFEKTARETCYIGRQPCPLASADADCRTRLLADCDLVLCANISAPSKQTLSTLGVDCSLDYAGAAVESAVSSL